MSRFTPKLVSVAAPRSMPGAGQMSHPSGFAPVAGRGRDLRAVRRVHGALPVLAGRDVFLRFWSGLMMRRCGSAHDVSRLFDVTEQTGRNWIDGYTCPSGQCVWQAQQWWPEEFVVAAGQGAA